MNALKRYSRTLFCSIGFIATALVAGCGGGDQGRDPILGLPAATLVSVAVSPATQTVAIGAAQQFVATASYSDGSSRDVTVGAAWVSATPAVATVNAATGMAAGVSVGSSSITAAFSGKTGSAVLTVVPVSLSSIAVLPANPSINVGGSQQFIAMGTFNNNTTRDISSLSTFASATPAVASINATTGLALGLTAGTSVITATSGALSGTTTLTVTPVTLVSIALAPQAPVLQMGAARQLTATATYSNGTTADVTATATYLSATPASVTVNAAGLITGVAAGSSVVTASFGGKTATTTATVGTATLSSIAVTPATASVAVAGKQQYVATATYSDNSTGIITSTVNWTSSSIATGTILNTGVATGVATGTTTITATFGAKSGSATLNVTAAVVPSASVNLRSAASFAVLAGTALTNNSGGTTLITGDVGSPSQTTDPTIAAGFTNYKSGAILAGALADLQTAITDARGRTCDVTFAADIDLGGVTLAPGVYCYAGAINITGTLTLSGSGTFIFRTAQTLNTASNSIVALTNGATYDNVTWVPVGPTTLGANSVFKGSILGQAAAITMGDNATLLNGRVLSAAAVTLRNNQVTK